MKFIKMNITIFGCIISSVAFALTPQSGKITAIKGTAERIDLAGKSTKLSIGSAVHEGDYVKTSSGSTTKVTLNDKSELNLGPNSKMQIEKIDETGKSPSAISMLSGSLRAKVQKAYSQNPKMLVKSGSTVMGIRGTDFQMVANANTGSATLVTLEGQVAMAKAANAAEPALNQAQAQALSKVAEVAEKNLEKQTPQLSPSTIQQMDKAAQLAIAEIAPPMAASDMKSISDAAKIVGNAVQPTMTASEVKAFYEVAKAIEFKSAMTPEQAQAVEAIKAMTASAPDGQPAKATVEQAKAMSMIETLATSTLKPEDMPPTAAQALATVDAAGSKVEPAGKLTEAQIEAVKDMQTITIPAGTAATQPMQLSAEQALAVAQLTEIAKETVNVDTLPPAQASAFSTAEKSSDKISEKSDNITPDQAQAMTKIHELAVQSKNATTPVDLNIEQTAALIKTGDAVEKNVPAGEMPAALTQAVAQANQVEIAAPQIAAMTFDKIEAITEAKELANEVAKGGGAPVAVTPDQASAMADTQSAAIEMAKGANLAPADKVALAVNDQVSQAIVADVQTPPVPAAEVTQTLADPSKVVEVGAGQFSGVSPAQPNPSVPVQVAPAQVEAMKNETGVAGVTTGNTQATVSTGKVETSADAKSAVTGKSVISPIPPGLNPKDVMPSAGEYKELLAATGVEVFDNKNAGGPPPEASFDPNTGSMKPTSGGFIDMNTGAYLPPPPGSTFDTMTGVYVAPPSMGGFDPNTGAFVPPTGFVMDASKGLVTTAEFSASNAAIMGGSGPQGGAATNSLGFDPSAAMANIPKDVQISFDTGAVFGGFQGGPVTGAPQNAETLSGMFQQAGYTPPAGAGLAKADFASQSGGALFGGMAPAAFTGGSMAAAPPPPGADPGAYAVAPTFMTSANAAYIPSNYAPPVQGPAGPYQGPQGGGPNDPMAGGGPGGPGMPPGGMPPQGGMYGGDFGMGGSQMMSFTDGGGLAYAPMGGMMGGMDPNMMFGGPMPGMMGSFDAYAGPNTVYMDPNMPQPLYPVYDPYACVYSGACSPTYIPGYTPPPPPPNSSSSVVSVTIN